MPFDATGHFCPARPVSRVVSLVPSDTENVAALCGASVLVGCTNFCTEPALPRVARVGGTKNVDVEAVIELGPELVLANKEENSERDVLRLRAAGLEVYVGFPCSVADVSEHLQSLAQLLGVPPLPTEEVVRAPSRRTRVFAPIWVDPYMTFDSRTYAGSMLDAAGLVNVFADRARRYPLAADLGHAAAREVDADTRYPRLGKDELRGVTVELVLLTDEPYEFGAADAEAFSEFWPSARVEFVSGKDLFWPGVRTASAVRRLAELA
jgi:ABC-type Fe3+-hydroxamate transport system substrate-binding protein